MSTQTLPESPLYDPKSRILNFKFAEDFQNIRLNLSGTRLLYKDTNFFHTLDKDKEWKRPKEICSRPIFVDGKPDRFDALQGQVGDCWLVNGIEAITLYDKLFQHVVPSDQSFDHDYIGAFHFRIWWLGTWYDVVVDDRIPVYKKSKKVCYVHSKRGDIFWAALLEKAFAKFSSSPFTSTYDALKGGYPMTSMQCLSGGIVEKVFTRDLTDKTLKWLMGKVFSRHALMTLSSLKSGAGLVEGHGYTVTEVYQLPDDDPDYSGFCFVRILNPWGNTEWEGGWSDFDMDHWGRFDQEIRQRMHQISRNDGEFWMRENDVIKYFDHICICHLGPGQYIESTYGTDFKSWKTTIVSGEWVRNISAGGSHISNRYKNPQYVTRFRSPKCDSNNPGLCTVVIELCSWSQYGRSVRPFIAFYIYTLMNKGNLPKPLHQQFFENEDPLNSNPDFEASEGRAYVESLTLEPGVYCIVPCTEREHEQSEFLLRIFSDSCENIWEYDDRVSKSLPSEEQCLNELDEELKKLFDDVAPGQEEIEWTGLKVILQKAMSTKRSYFDLFVSFFKTIRDVFHTFLSIRSSNDYESGDIVFSKDECRSMVAMLDNNHSGKLSFSEVSHLWSKISFWSKVYERHRDETEGYLRVSQLKDALSSIGYKLNKRTVHSLSYVYANDQGNIFLTDFIICGVTLETVLSIYEKEHSESENKIMFTLEEWVKRTLIL